MIARVDAIHSATQRDAALDAFRGLAIVGMVLVNTVSASGRAFAPLTHAPWHGWSLADLVFPAFLFAVGMSIAMGLPPRSETGAAPRWRILRRTLLLFLIGLALEGFPYYDPANMRVCGVLQRIALCYLAAAALHRLAASSVIVAAVAATLLGYWAILGSYAAPGFMPGDLTVQGNIAGYVDRLLLGPHLSVHTDRVFDPEGVLSTLPAIGSTLIGVLAGRFVVARPSNAVRSLTLAGTALIVAGLAWDHWLPINKNLWTGSYALFAGGVSTLVYAWFRALIAMGFDGTWARVLSIMGMNALALYVGSRMLQALLFYVRFPLGAHQGERIRDALYTMLLVGWAAPEVASLVYGVAFLVLWFVILAGMARAGVYLRV